MTLKRKLGIVAGLVVVVLAGLVVVFQSSEPGPDPPFTASFVRYENTNTVVVRIVNHTKSRMHYDASETGNGLLVLTSSGTNELGALQSRELRVELLSGLNARDVQVVCFRKPSKLQLVGSWLAQKLSQEGPKLESWEVIVPLPLRNPSLP